MKEQRKNKVELEAAIVSDVLLDQVDKWYLVKSKSEKYALLFKGFKILGFGPDFEETMKRHKV